MMSLTFRDWKEKRKPSAQRGTGSQCALRSSSHRTDPAHSETHKSERGQAGEAQPERKIELALLALPLARLLSVCCETSA